MTPPKIIQGGQTGVDRGAWLAAHLLHLPRGGYMPMDMRDEDGYIPRIVQQDLVRSSSAATLSMRTMRNVVDSDAVLVIVQNAKSARSTPGTTLTIREAELHDKPMWITDSFSKGACIATAEWLGVAGAFSDGEKWKDREFRLMVAGPRKSMWPAAEVYGFNVVTNTLGALLTMATTREKPRMDPEGLIEDPEHEIRIKHNPDWSGDALVIIGTEIRWYCDAKTLARGLYEKDFLLGSDDREFRGFHVDPWIQVRVAAMAAAAYTAYVITTAVKSATPDAPINVNLGM